MDDLHTAIEHFENNSGLRQEFSFTLQAMKDARDAFEASETKIEIDKITMDNFLGQIKQLESKAEAQQKVIEQLESAIRQWLDLREWCLAAGGAEGPLPQDVIQKFAEMQAPIVDAMQ